MAEQQSNQLFNLKFYQSEEFYKTSKAKYEALLAKSSFCKFDREYYTSVYNTMLQMSRRSETNTKRDDDRSKYDQKFELIQEKFGRSYLIQKRLNSDDRKLRCLPWEDSFDVLFCTHVTNHHAQGPEMLRLVKEKYAINHLYIYYFLQCCPVCQKQESPVVHKKTMKGNKVALSIIDMNYCPDGILKYLFVYNDMHTRYVFLRPLITKCEFEIASEIMQIIASFGLPAAFVVNNKDETFFKRVHHDLEKLGVNIMNVRIESHNVSCNNMYIVNCLRQWMEDTASTNWGLGCHVVQWRMNNDYADTDSIRRRNNNFGNKTAKSPHHCVFGRMPYTYYRKNNLDSDSEIDWSDEDTNSVEEECVDDDNSRIEISNNVEEEKTGSDNPNLTICVVCECKIAIAHSCLLCSKSVHSFCCEISKSSLDSSLSLYKCLKCVEMKNLK